MTAHVESEHEADTGCAERLPGPSVKDPQKRFKRGIDATDGVLRGTHVIIEEDVRMATTAHDEVAPKNLSK
jgi:hypothetical protein